MTEQNFSLYLEPTGEVKNLLEQVIDRLAREFGGPIFAPHLTLIPDRLGTVGQIQDQAKNIAQQINWPLTLTFDQIGTGQTRFQCVYLKAQPTPELSAASQIARQVFMATDLPDIMPHLTLFYADEHNQPSDQLTRSKIARRAEELLEDKLPIQFTCQKITIHTSGADVSSWHQVGSS